MAQAPKPDTPPPAEHPENPLAGLVRGRKVYYYPRPHEAKNVDPGPWSATVTNTTHEIPGTVTLNVDMPEPAMVGNDPVHRMRAVPFSATQEPGCWGWMFDGQNTRYTPDRTA